MQSLPSRAVEWALTRVAPRYRPVAHTFERCFPPAPKLDVRLDIGSVTVIGDPTLEEIRIHCAVRSRDTALARQRNAVEARNGETLELRFDGPSTMAGNTVTSIDVVVSVPPLTACTVRNSLGPIRISGLGRDIDAHASLGSTRVILAPQWSGNFLDLSCDMGSLRLAVPDGVRLDVDPVTEFGKARIEVPSFPGNAPARVRCGMGSLTVTRA